MWLLKQDLRFVFGNPWISDIREKDWFHPFCFRTREFRFLDQFYVINVFGIWVLNIVSCIPQAHVYKWWKPSGKMYDVLCQNLRFALVVFWGMFGWVSIYFTRLFYSISLFWKMEISLVNVALLFLFLTRCISLLETNWNEKESPSYPKRDLIFNLVFTLSVPFLESIGFDFGPYFRFLNCTPFLSRLWRNYMRGIRWILGMMRSLYTFIDLSEPQIISCKSSIYYMM